MIVNLSAQESRALHDLLEQGSGDIVLRLDTKGFITQASENAASLGHDLASLLLMPHISDLAASEYKSTLAAYAQQVLYAEQCQGWLEFPILTRNEEQDSAPAVLLRWFALNLRPVLDEAGELQGAIGLLRSVERVRALEGELHARAVTDPLTGLANRHSLGASLRRHLANGGGQFVAVFAVDRMRAIFMQYGQRTADEIMWGFAKFLETMALPGHELAQIDNERFGVILTGVTRQEARTWAEEVLDTFSQLTIPASSRTPKLTASAGLARVECTVDWTLRQAELALVMARAGGGMKVAQCRQPNVAANGAAPIPTGLQDRCSMPDAVGFAAKGR
jgi:GGDEF domain-containing protein